MPPARATTQRRTILRKFGMHHADTVWFLVLADRHTLTSKTKQERRVSDRSRINKYMTPLSFERTANGVPTSLNWVS